VALEALKVLEEEKLAGNAEKMGSLFRESLQDIQSKRIKIIRGKGLLNAVEIKPYKGKTAWDVCLALKENGLLAKPTHGHIIRFAPPLIIDEADLLEGVEIIRETLENFD
jgi:ornithine--oxo-acid transaminase